MSLMWYCSVLEYSTVKCSNLIGHCKNSISRRAMRSGLYIPSMVWTLYVESTYKLTCLHPHVLVYFYKVVGAALDYYPTVTTACCYTCTLKQLGTSTMYQWWFRNPQALSSVLAGAQAPQPRAFGFLNPVAPLVSVPNYYLNEVHVAT